MEKARASKIRERVLLSIFGAIWICGFVFCLLGVYAYNGPGKLADNPIYQAQKSMAAVFGLPRMVDFRFFGSMLCLLAMVFFLAIFYHYANKYDRVSERKKRQAERLKSLIEKEKQEEAVEAAAASDQAEN